MIEGPIARTLPRFSLPILYAGIAGWLSVSINTIWVGRLLGETGLAAAANANIVVFQMIGLAFGLTNGAAVLIGRHVGAGDMLAAKRMVGTSLCFFGLLSLVILTIGLVFTRPLLLALNTPVEALPQAIAYAQVMFLAVPNIYLFSFMMSGVRGAGDSKTPARFTYLIVAVDIVLNPLLILGVGPLPALGIAGSPGPAFAPMRWGWSRCWPRSIAAIIRSSCAGRSGRTCAWIARWWRGCCARGCRAAQVSLPIH